jgi:poly(hydroxyalkanoate) granule-associated protein
MTHRVVSAAQGAKTMATEVKAAPAEGAKNDKEQSQLLEMARKVLLAGLGAVALAQDEVEAFVARLVERGEIAEKDGKQLVRELMERRKKRAEEFEGQFSKRIEEILERMNLPTQGDIEALGEKIAALSKKVDDLKKTQG